jgi:hypothetical protein
MDTVKRVHIDTIKCGDTVLCKDGITRTVGNSNIKHGQFMGTTLFGDSYMLGHELVQKVIIKTVKPCK